MLRNDTNIEQWPFVSHKKAVNSEMEKKKIVMWSKKRLRLIESESIRNKTSNGENGWGSEISFANSQADHLKSFLRLHNCGSLIENQYLGISLGDWDVNKIINYFCHVHRGKEMILTISDTHNKQLQLIRKIVICHTMSGRLCERSLQQRDLFFEWWLLTFERV